MAEYSTTKHALPEPEFGALRSALLNSPWVASSQLNGAFVTSRGFGVTFTLDGRTQAVRELPELAPFLALAIDGSAESTLMPFWSRQRPPAPNAWYLNLLLVGAAGGVAAHTDATLGAVAGVPGTSPRVVSVLYLKVPSCGGGELVLARGAKWVGAIRPVEGMLLHFRGDLLHQVRSLENAGAGDVRASLVLEQYHFADAQLSLVPPFRLESRAKFRLALDASAHRPLPQFDVER